MTHALVAINGEGHKHEVGPIRLQTRGREIAAASLIRLVWTGLKHVHHEVKCSWMHYDKDSGLGLWKYG